MTQHHKFKLSIKWHEFKPVIPVSFWLSYAIRTKKDGKWGLPVEEAIDGLWPDNGRVGVEVEPVVEYNLQDKDAGFEIYVWVPPVQYRFNRRNLYFCHDMITKLVPFSVPSLSLYLDNWEKGHDGQDATGVTQLS